VWRIEAAALNDLKREGKQKKKRLKGKRGGGGASRKRGLQFHAKKMVGQIGTRHQTNGPHKKEPGEGAPSRPKTLALYKGGVTYKRQQKKFDEEGGSGGVRQKKVQGLICSGKKCATASTTKGPWVRNGPGLGKSTLGGRGKRKDIPKHATTQIKTHLRLGSQKI